MHGGSAEVVVPGAMVVVVVDGSGVVVVVAGGAVVVASGGAEVVVVPAASVVVVAGSLVVVVVVGTAVVVVDGAGVVVDGSGAHWSSELHSTAQHASCPLPLAEQKNGVPASQQWPLVWHSRVTLLIESKPQHSPSGPSQQMR
jgi:hypothetical protein